MKLHDYQREAVEFLRERGSAGLFLDMGLGKTAITLSALEDRHLPVLVTAPKRVAEHVWAAEAKLWRPDLRVAVASGPPAKRKAALESGADVVVIGRDNLSGAVPHAKSFRTFVMDELSSFKSRASKRWKAARKISRSTSIRYVWGLTGTPSPNGLMDLWAQIYLLDGGDRLGHTLGVYRERYFTPGRQLRSGVITEWLPREGADSRIHRKLEDLCLSMSTEGRVDIPPVTVNRVEVPLPPEARRIYKEMKDSLVVDLDLLGDETYSAGNAAILTSKLTQISAGFLYSDEALVDGVSVPIHREKVKALTEIVEGTGSPVLVFYRYRAELELYLEAFPMGGTMDEAGIIERWNRREVPVLFAHPASAGHGLNLQHGGHTIVWTTASWSLEEDLQANKRLARQGQTSPVVIHYLVSPHTLDKAILERLETKESVQHALLKHLEGSV